MPQRLQGELNVPLIVGVAALLGIQVYWTARSIAIDYSRRYSGLDAANYLRSVGATRLDVRSRLSWRRLRALFSAEHLPELARTRIVFGVSN